MIKSQLGKVQLTKPNYELAKELNMPTSDVDAIIKAMLSADLSAILNALTVRYGVNQALDMWYDVVKLYVEDIRKEN